MFSKTIVSVASCALLFTAGSIFLADWPHSATAATATAATPAYDKNGDLLPLANYREWVYLTSGIDMSYTANTGMDSQSRFDNVFVDPAAYRSFLETGTWPDRTTMVLEVRAAKSRGSINLSGHYQGTEILGLEVHVKDEARFPGKWAFYAFDTPGANGKLIPPTAACYTCHAAHGAVDTTFVQFYPTLLPIARKRGTLSRAFQNEDSDSKAIK